MEERKLGRILGSRIVVKVSESDGRMSDLLLVQADRREILRQRVSSARRTLSSRSSRRATGPATRVTSERTTSGLGVPGIIFIDLSGRPLHLVRRRGGDYEETSVSSGTVAFEAVDRLVVQSEWIFGEPRPAVRGTLNTVPP